MNAKELILQANELAREQSLSQAEWSRRAGYDEFGKVVHNTLKNGDCKLKVMTQLLKPLGCSLTITKNSEDIRCPFNQCLLEFMEVLQE